MKNSDQRQVIMDLSLPHPHLHSVNAITPTTEYLRQSLKISLIMPEDMCALIRKEGRGYHLYAVDVARAYHQLPVSPQIDWCLICLHTST